MQCKRILDFFPGHPKKIPVLLASLLHVKHTEPNKKIPSKSISNSIIKPYQTVFFRDANTFLVHCSMEVLRFQKKDYSRKAQYATIY